MATYWVTEVYEVYATGYVEADSPEEALQKIDNGVVEVDWVHDIDFSALLRRNVEEV